MEELLKIVYLNFISEETTSTSKELKIVRDSEKGIDEATEKLQELLSDKIFTEIYDLIYDSLSDTIEASFVAGFSQCAKMLSNGKLDFFPEDVGGAK